MGGRCPQWQQLREHTGACRRHCWGRQNPDPTLAGDTVGFTESSHLQPGRTTGQQTRKKEGDEMCTEIVGDRRIGGSLGDQRLYFVR